MDTYKDMLEKLKYHKQLIMNAFIKRNYYPSNDEVNAALQSVNSRLSLFESYISKPGQYFNPAEINYCFEMIHQDIKILYGVLQNILVNEYADLKLHTEATLVELENKANYFSKRCIEEINSSTLGTTLLFKTGDWNIDTQDQYTIIDLGDCDFVEGSTIGCFANINNTTKDSVIFNLSTYDDSEDLLMLPYNLYDNISYKIPGVLEVKMKEFTIGTDLIIDDYIKVNYEINSKNDYKILNAKNYITVTYKNTGRTELVEFPDMNNYNFLAVQDCYIEFYVVDGNVGDSAVMEYNFNMAPSHCNFSLHDGTIKLDKDIKRIYIEAQSGLLVSFSKEYGTIYAECNDAIMSDVNTLLYRGNLKSTDLVLREYIKSNTTTYNVKVYINSEEDIINSIESIYIKELS